MILLETLPGWPEAEPLPALFYILLLVVAPLATGGIITALVFARSWVRKARED